MGLPVAHSLMGKGALRDDHPLVMGMTGFWGTTLVNQTCLECRHDLCRGHPFQRSGLFQLVSGLHVQHRGQGQRCTVIHIDIEPQEIGRNYPTEIGVVADAKSALRVLIRVAKRNVSGRFCTH